MSLEAVRNRFIKMSGRKDLAKTELVTNGDFATDSYGWNLQDGWDYGSGKVTFTPADQYTVSAGGAAMPACAFTELTSGGMLDCGDGYTAFASFEESDYIYISGADEAANDGYYIVTAVTEGGRYMYLSEKVTTDASDTGITIYKIGLLTQAMPYIGLTPGEKYTVGFTISDWTAGSITVRLGITDVNGGTTYTFDSDATSTESLNLLCSTYPELDFQPSYDFAGSLDSISVVPYLSTEDTASVLAGADIYINAGQQYLDTKVDTPASPARYQIDITAGDYVVNLYGCAEIYNVWIINSDGRSELERQEIEDLKYYYEGDTLTNTDSDTPLYYAVNITSLSPQQSSLTSGTYSGTFTYEYEDINFGSHYDNDDRTMIKSLLIMPPTDETYTLVVYGKFYSPTLWLDADTSFWTEQYPEILCYAAMYCLNVEYENAQKVGYWKAVIDDAVSGIQDILEYDKTHYITRFDG